MRIGTVRREVQGLTRRRPGDHRPAPRGSELRPASRAQAPGKSAAGTGRGDFGTATKRRPDLQGVRALAVLLVALDHANVPFLRGGYVGVDVFFVLSGYFITGMLFREALGGEEPSGRISFLKFYARRARRILPAATLTLIFTSLAVYVVYDLLRADFLQTKPTLLDALASSLFYANIHFAATSTNYFAQATTTMPSPVQHFWSLSVEEQFYLVWPSVLAATFFLTRRLGRTRGFDRRRATAAAGVLIAVVCGGSLAWSIHATDVSAQSAYFSTFARTWEFGLGAGMALIAPGAAALPARIRIPLGWLGLAMVMAAAITYSPATAFPGDAALLPTVGTVLLILGGLGVTRLGADRILAIRPMAYIGDRSYTFYLWHYPVLIIVWQAAGHVLPVVDNLALLAGAFAIAALTFHFYENPIRFSLWLRGWRTAALIPVSLAASVTAILIPILAFQGTLASEAVAAEHANVQALAPAHGLADPTNPVSYRAIPEVADAVAAAKRAAALPEDIVPSNAQLAQENQLISYDIPNGCQPSFGSGVTSNICKLGDASSSVVVAVIGDSHAGMWMPGLIKVADEEHFAVVPLDKPGCFVNRLHKNLSGFPCGSWYEWALKQDRALHPTATIVAFETPTSLQKPAAATVSELRAVLGQVTNGVVLQDPPEQTKQPSTCVNQTGATMKTCSVTVPASYPGLYRDIESMAARAHRPLIPTIQWFCGSGVCPMVIDHTITTRDIGHLTMQYSAAMAPLLAPELARVLSFYGQS